MSVNQAALLELSGRLRQIECGIPSPATTEFDPWRNMWTGLVGSAVCLYEALPFLPMVAPHLTDRGQRPFDIVVAECRGILDDLRANSLAKPQDTAMWSSGFWLNGAEFRVSIVLHQVLKSAYGCERAKKKLCSPDDVHNLLSGILRLEPCKCGSDFKTPSVETQAILGGVLDVVNEAKETRERERLDPSEEKALELSDPECLGLVHCETNGLKHERLPVLDKLSPERRWHTDTRALATLTGVFEDFGHKWEWASKAKAD